MIYDYVYVSFFSEIRPTKITKAYLLAAAYCSTFGGTGTLVGTGTNLTFKGIYENTFPEAEGISFTDWMIASFPQMVVNSFLTWLYVRIAYMGYLRPHSKDAQMATIGREGEAVTNQVRLYMKSHQFFSTKLILKKLYHSSF